MRSPVDPTAKLITGERMDVEEFLRCWEELPDLKNAELIDGVVHVSSPVSRQHGSLDSLIHMWLGYYAQATPGCEGGNNSTWLMLDSAPQPDADLRILPAQGGQSKDDGIYSAGAPELAVEVCVSSTDVDFGPKLRLYQRAGVQEYITAETLQKRLIWRVLDENHAYKFQLTTEDGILRSQVFPGLWLDVAAFWAKDGAKMLAALNAGIASEDHQRFVERLGAGKQ